MPLAVSVTKSNVPQNELLRWNVEKAAVEFGMTPVMLGRALARISAVPGADGCYSTAQLIEAAFGNMYQEKLATQRQVTERYSLENRVTRGEVLSRSELSKGLAGIVDAVVSRIMATQELSRTTKEDLLKDLGSWPLVLEEVSRAQSRLRRSGKLPDGET
jgi:hypothetical protein